MFIHAMKRFVRTSANNSELSVYHTDDSCRMLQRAQNYREASQNETEQRGLTECDYCSGEYEPSTTQTMKYQNMLKEAAKQNAD